MADQTDSGSVNVAGVSAVSALSPSRVRYKVLAVVCSLSVISYLDRVCIAGSRPYIVAELGLTPSQMGAIFTAFGIAYAAFEVPSGWLGDMIGPRKVMTRIVVWWSVFTTLTGLMHRFWTMWIVRFLFGAGEAGAYPNTTKIISNWMPRLERGFAQGVVWTCGRLGGAFAPWLTVLLIGHFGWRQTFWMYGTVGIAWALFFWPWFRDTPREKPEVNEAELRIIQGDAPLPSGPAKAAIRTPWMRLLKSGNLWTICWMYACMAYPWYFYITWLPTYLEQRGLPRREANLYGGAPLFFGAVGCYVGGVLTDYIVRRTGDLRNRRYVGCAGFLLGGVCTLASVWSENPLAPVVAFSLASFFGDMTMGSCWAVCLDVGHELAGTVSGCMNTWGNLGGALSPLVAGFLLQHFGTWNPAITVSGMIFLLGAFLWLRIDPNRSVLE